MEASKDDPVSVKFLETKESLWKQTEKLDSFLGRAGEFEAIFFVGGHGRTIFSLPLSYDRKQVTNRKTAMFDLATDETSHKLINEFYTHNKIISAVCHGPAALAYVKTSSGKFLLEGEPATGFSNTEEEAVGLTKAMPFSLEDKLNEATGGKYEKHGDWAAKVVVSRNGTLITGQNPASAGPVGQAIYDGIFGQLTTKVEV